MPLPQGAAFFCRCQYDGPVATEDCVSPRAPDATSHAVPRDLYSRLRAYIRGRQARPGVWCPALRSVRNLLPIATGLVVFEDLDVAGGMPGRHGNHFVASVAELQIYGRITHRQLADGERFYTDRQDWPLDVNVPTAPVDAHSKAGLQQHENGAGCPRLRQAGDWVRCGPLSGPAREAAVQLRQTHAELVRCLEDLAEDVHYAVAPQVARDPRRTQRGIVRPDGAI